MDRRQSVEADTGASVDIAYRSVDSQPLTGGRASHNLLASVQCLARWATRPGCSGPGSPCFNRAAAKNAKRSPSRARRRSKPMA